MKKAIKIIFVSTIFLSLLGCLENETGSIGPAWDTTYDIPIIGVTTETAINLFKDTENIVIPEESNKDTRIRIQENFSDLDPIEVGSTLTDIELPNNTEYEKLDPLEVNNIGSIDTTISIPGSNSSGSISNISETITVSGIDVAKFSSNDSVDNNFIFTLSNSIDSGTLSGISIDITYTDSDNIEKNNSTDSITMSSIGKGRSEELIWNLSGKDINFSSGLVISVNAEAESYSGQVDISFGFSKVEIIYADGLDSNRVSPSTFSPDSLSVGDIESGVDYINFENGGIFLEIDPYENSGLEFDVTQFKINNLEDKNNDGEISFTLESSENEELNIVSWGGLNINLEVSVTTSSSISTITYDTTKDITIASGFRDNTSISSVTISKDFNRFDDANTDINEEILEDVPEFIKDIDLATDSAISFTLDGIPSGLKVDLSNSDFIALGDNNTTISSLSLSEIGSNGGVIDNLNPKFNFLDNDGNSNLLIWLKGLDNLEDIKSVRLVGTTLVGTDNTVTLSKDDVITPSMEIDLPLDFKLNEDYTENFTPSSFKGMENKEIKYLKKSELIIEKLDNGFPISIDLEIFIGNVSSWNNLSDDELENLEDSELESLFYNEENLLTEINISGNTSEKKVISFDEKDFDKLVGDNLFLGFRAIIPKNDPETNERITLNRDDEIRIEKVHLKTTIKINQD